jgi:imidazolonepropionase-like amidohydrolase
VEASLQAQLHGTKESGALTRRCRRTIELGRGIPRGKAGKRRRVGSARSPWVTLLALWAALSLAPAQAQVTALVHATLIDGTGKAPLQDATVLIEGDTVRAVGPAASVPLPAGASTVDLTGKFLMPGIINLHAHVGLTKGVTPDASHHTRENIESDLRRYATYGVTTVLSLGHDNERVLAVRDEQRRGKLSGARVYTAGTGFSVKNGYPLAIAPFVQGLAHEVADAAEATAYVDSLAKMRVDVVKMWVDDNRGQLPKLTPEIWRAAIRRAHQHGLKVFAHMWDLEDARGLARDGLDVIAHSIRDQEVDDDLIASLKKQNVTAVGTISRERSLFSYATGPEWLSDAFFTKGVTPEVLREVTDGAFQKRQASDPNLDAHRKAFEIDVRNLKRLSDAGVRIAFGTDSGQPARFPGFFEHWEMELMVQAGLTPMQVIESFSKNAADALAVKSLGAIEPGKVADFIVLDRNPLSDIRNTRSIHAVYLGGREFR